jgi:hypothetical protein
MSQDANTDLRNRTQQLLDGPLKHVRAAALAAALVPLASIFATPASAQTICASGGAVCGTVFNDTNGNSVQDAGEPGVANQPVLILCTGCSSDDTITVFTDDNGNFVSPPVDNTTTFSVAVLIPTGSAPSGPGGDSAGTSNGAGYSVATNVVPNGLATDFGFVPSKATNPGTGTPGYWKNHPEAWPVASITVGGLTYTKAAAIAWLGNVGKDKSTTMFSALVPAMLNLLIGNDGSCVNAAIAAGNTWMAAHPVGSNIAGSSAAWAQGQPIQQTLDAYNNGLLCAPHRQ